VGEQIAGEWSPEELQEFLEADQLPVPVDPAFKERLREELWHRLQERSRQRRRGED